MKKTKIDLNGAVVAITGGGRGIGRCTALAFAEAGSKLALGDIDLDSAQSVAAEIGPSAMAFHLDVTSRESFENFITNVEEQVGPVDVLVNNAGIMSMAAFLEEDEQVSRSQLDINVWGPITGMRAALPGMVRRNRGHIVNVASIAGRIEIPGLSVYCASKFAVIGLSASVREELRDTGVSVTSVQPTAVRTELTSGITLGKGLPTVDPEDVADAIVATVKNRPKQVTVPWVLNPVLSLAGAVPNQVIAIVRKLIGDDRGLTDLDPAARAAYDARIAKGAKAKDSKPAKV